MISVEQWRVFPSGTQGGVTEPSVTGRAIRTSRDELSLSTFGDDLPEPELR